MNSHDNITECICCGTCCKKGGPAFHKADKALIEKGLIKSNNLFTIREGEPAYDNIKECIQPVASDIIKIKNKKSSRTCIFFDEIQRICLIYKKRPLECQVLQCWDTRAIEALYSKDRLTRKDLLEKNEGIWEIIKDHQEHCCYEKLAELAKNYRFQADQKSKTAILEMIRYDAHMRDLIIEKSHLAPDLLDFLFGSPLYKTIQRFHLRLQTDNNKLTLKALNLNNR